MAFQNDSFSLMFTIMPILILAGFILFFGVFIFIIIKGVSRRKYNNSQPVLSVTAKVVSKRADVSSNMHHDKDSFANHHTYTTYYVAFEVESGDRMEFQIEDNEYGLLIERDLGKLTFQGTRYIGFKREIR